MEHLDELLHEISQRGDTAQEIQRGVSPRILLDQVRNTTPFLIEGLMPGEMISPWRYWAVLKRVALLLKLTPDPDLSHSEYYELCLSAHWGTVASFVPTDVDNQIRFRLWNPRLSQDEIRRMAALVTEARNWDVRAVSTRYVDVDGYIISGHSGEWFSVAVGAYGALRRRDPEIAAEMVAAIVDEVEAEARAFRELRKRGDGINLLKLSTIIAHNLGDLDRVIDMWNLDNDDALKSRVYKAGHDDAGRFGAALVDAGHLNKEFMAQENHRHFALRRPKCLRRSQNFLLPVGPFFDGWGGTIARELAIEEVGEVVEALVEGWEWMRKKQEPGARPLVGYARAIAGILESTPGGPGKVHSVLPRRVAATVKTGELHTAIAMPRGRFEEAWNKMPFNFLAKLKR